MSDLMHWHGTPSTLAEPADCCKSAIEKAHGRELDEAVHAERRRVILAARESVLAYGGAAFSVLDGERAQLVAKVTAELVKALTATGCICPRLDVQRFGESSGRTVLGRDHRCGMHETEVS